MPTKKKKPKRWSQNVKTVSTFPPERLFTKDARTVARVMATKKVSPKGIGSGIRMIKFFINRAGKNLSPAQRKELEEAKHILQQQAREAKSRREKRGGRAHGEHGRRKSSHSGR